MKYEDWCVEYYNRENGNCGEIKTQERKIADVSQRLVKRINYLTDKYYGDRKFVSIPFRFMDMDTINAYIDEIEKKQEKTERTIKKRKNEYLSIFNNHRTELAEDEWRRKLDAKQRVINRLKKEYQELEESKADAGRGEAHHLDILLDSEIKLFEALLKISKGMLRYIRNDDWELVDRECRQEILQALYELQEVEHWQLTRKDMERIEVKLAYPVMYNIYMVQKGIEENNKFKNDPDIRKAILKIDKAANKLYKRIYIEDQNEKISNKEKSNGDRIDEMVLKAVYETIHSDSVKIRK